MTNGERARARLVQTAAEIFPHIVKEDRSGSVSFGQRVAPVRQLAAAVQQGIADRLENCDRARWFLKVKRPGSRFARFG